MKNKKSVEVEVNGKLRKRKRKKRSEEEKMRRKTKYEVNEGMKDSIQMKGSRNKRDDKYI